MDKRTKTLADALMGYTAKKNDIASIFYKNYNDMKEANTKKADKYFHAKANCEAGQRNALGTALSISIGREIVDGIYNNPYVKKLPLKTNLLDCKDDLYVDLYGLYQGYTHPYDNCTDLVKKYRPNGLNERY